jgi:uncharacterized protein YndB with AHSA1/START domain
MMNKGLGDAVVMERTFDAPVELVWRMWTDPEHFKAWYGPAGATVSVENMELRVGGLRQVSMEVDSPRGPMKMSFAGQYLEVVDQKRLVYTESVSDTGGMMTGKGATEVRVDLEDLGGRTKMVLTHVGVPAGSPGETGWSMAIDKLAAYLEAQGN